MFLMHFPHAHRGNYFTVYREGDWKLIYYYLPENPKQPEAVLYNLKEDQEEKEELSSVFPDKCREMIRNMIFLLKKKVLFILLINWEISWNHLFISNDTVQATAYADTEWVVNPALLPPETKSVALTLRVKLVQLLRFGMVRIGKYAPCRHR